MLIARNKLTNLLGAALLASFLGQPLTTLGAAADNPAELGEVIATGKAPEGDSAAGSNASDDTPNRQESTLTGD
ncbi:MAG TPA: hypothetical protein PLW86_20190, partial [Rhodocyclaceae bacterium]|nr:hypothetical protein [Rhodocyclaceae bacterium]